MNTQQALALTRVQAALHVAAFAIDAHRVLTAIETARQGCPTLNSRIDALVPASRNWRGFEPSYTSLLVEMAADDVGRVLGD